MKDKQNADQDASHEHVKKVPNLLRACERHIGPQAGNCSGFVIDVANDFGIKLKGLANDIYDYLNCTQYVVNYGVGEKASKKAAKDASEGKFLVIAASRSSSGNGHVAVVTGLDDKGNVLVYGGKLHHAAEASRNERITIHAWGKYKLSDPYIVKEPPCFFGIPVLSTYRL